MKYKDTGINNCSIHVTLYLNGTDKFLKLYLLSYKLNL